MNLAVFISGRGSNLKALLDAQREGYFSSKICLVVSNKEAEGLDYAREEGIDYLVSKDDKEIIRTMKDKNIDLVVLAGYLPKIRKDLIDNFTLINIHPSLLPKYGGKGYYGMNVHRAVFKNGEKTSGVTVHYVNEKLDDGKIILQREIDISKCESAEEVADEVLVVEHEILKDAIKLLEEK